MKNFTKLFALAVVILGFSVTSFAQPLIATATSTGTLVAAISITHTGTDMSFGNIVAGVAGTVVLVPAGTRSVGSGSLTLVGGVVTAAQFTVTGTAGSNYTITLPGTVVVTNVNDSQQHMDVTGFTHDASGTLDGISEDFSVGATLNILGSETAFGAYTSTAFDVSVVYE